MRTDRDDSTIARVADQLVDLDTADVAFLLVRLADHVVTLVERLDDTDADWAVEPGWRTLRHLALRDARDVLPVA